YTGSSALNMKTAFQSAFRGISRVIFLIFSVLGGFFVGLWGLGAGLGVFWEKETFEALVIKTFKKNVSLVVGMGKEVDIPWDIGRDRFSSYDNNKEISVS
ncbi:hypothetical protein ACFL3V_06890, partial [Nanoarchaeota archaeon]